MRQILFVLALVMAGCSDNPAAPSGPTTSIVYFSGTLAVQGSNFIQSPLTKAGTFAVTLVSLTTGTPFTTTNPPVSPVVGVGIGVASADGTTCTVNTSTTTGPGFTAQLTGPVAVGTACVQISDVNNLTEPVNFVIRFAYTS
jgi:hypothetical protein